MARRRIVTREKRDFICSTMASELPAVLHGDWSAFCVESGDYKIRLAWNKECDKVNLTGYIFPHAEDSAPRSPKKRAGKAA